MQLAIESGNVTSRELVQLYLDRIAQLQEPINAVAYLSRTALDEADAARSRARVRPVRGPLHGIPIAVKDIINTTNMPTTGGAVAFAGHRAAVRRAARRQSEAGRRDHHRQDDVDRAGQLGHRRHAGQLQRVVRVQHESVRPASRSA